MATEFERSIAAITAVYRESKGLPPLKGEEIPASLRKDTERDEEPADENTSDWPDDHKLDDPRRGQAKDINRKRIF